MHIPQLNYGIIERNDVMNRSKSFYVNGTKIRFKNREEFKENEHMNYIHGFGFLNDEEFETWCKSYEDKRTDAEKERDHERYQRQVYQQKYERIRNVIKQLSKECPDNIHIKLINNFIDKLESEEWL